MCVLQLWMCKYHNVNTLPFEITPPSLVKFLHRVMDYVNCFFCHAQIVHYIL